MVSTHAEGQWIYWLKDSDYGAVKQEEKRKTTDKVYGCSERGHAVGWCDSRELEIGIEMDDEDPLW